MKRTKIIATIGPASYRQSTIEKMAKAGMNVCRLNFSFGTQEEHFKVISAIRKASKNTDIPLAIMQDLQGPKIRIGKLKAPVTVKKGDEIILSGNAEHKEKFYFPTSYSQIASDTEIGKTILIADGRIIFEVTETDEPKKEVHCRVIEGGAILSGKGINLPYTNISLPSMTEKDIEDSIFGAKVKVDYVCLSFVRKAEDITKLRKLLRKYNSGAAIISKIEKPEAIDNIDAIIEETDGIMVARGDLATEISFAKVPLIQKEIIKRANKKGKFTIIATEMLSSMTDNQLPTRAEVSDVANGVLEGADLIMLSNETAVGKYPVKSVRTMAKIAEEAESVFTGKDFFAELELPEVQNLIEALCYSATSLSYELSNDAIAVFTKTGLTARILSKFRPEATIFAATYKEDTYQKMALYNNVYPILLNKEDFQARDVMYRTIPALEEKLYKKHLIRKGRKFIILTGEYIDNKWTSINTIKIKTFAT